MEVDRLQPIFDIETRTGLLDPGEVSMTENLGFGIVGAEALEKFYHGLLLGWSASVGWVAVGIETALVANADAVGVVMLGMGADFALRAAGVDYSIFRDVVVVADGAEATSLVAGFQGFYREIPVNPCGCTMDYNHVYFSHNEFFFIIFSFLFYNIFSKITPSLFTIKEGSTSHPDPLTLRGEGETAPTRRSEPLRSKVDGPSKVSSDCLCGVNRLAESLLVRCLLFACGAALGYSPSPLGSATLDAKSGRDGGEDGDEELNDFATGFFFHDF